MVAIFKFMHINPCTSYTPTLLIFVLQYVKLVSKPNDPLMIILTLMLHSINMMNHEFCPNILHVLNMKDNMEFYGTKL